MLRRALLACLVSVVACTQLPISAGQDGVKPGKKKTAKATSESEKSAQSGGDDDDDNTATGGPRIANEETFPPVDTSELDPFFQDQMQRANIPGMSVAVVRGGALKWAKGYGVANRSSNKKVSKDTLFMLASVSKTVTGVALMSLIEDPKNGISLDQDINGKLPFSVRNPMFPSVPITYRMVLTHSSTLIDSDFFWNDPAQQPQRHQGDFPVPLVQYERDYTARRDSWSANRPGTKFDYSNTGTALAGLLVEQISGKNLQDYCMGKIFQPLDMTETSWFLRDLDQSHIAHPYEGTDLEDKGLYGYVDYPDGQLRTSAPQLSRFLRMFAQGGQLNGQRVLQQATVTEMRRSQIPALEQGQGIIWHMGGNGVDMGHTGSDDGVSTEIWFNTQTGAGYVLLTNGRNTASEQSVEDATIAIGDKLMELADGLP